MSDTKVDIKGLEEQAKQGDTESMVKLGVHYLYGSEAVEKDDKKAIAWFEQAAQQGDTSSMVRMGNHYKFGGAGVASDYQKAIKWFEQAAELGDANASMALGSIYLYGEGVDVNLQEAASHYEDAANKGFPYGAAYAVTAYEEMGNYEAALKVLNKFADDPKTDVTTEARFLNQIGSYYEEGKGVKKDYNTALEYHKKAGTLGLEDSMHRAASLYESGKGGVTQNADEAQRWRDAAELAKYKEREPDDEMGQKIMESKQTLNDARQALDAFKQSDGYQVSAQDIEQRVGRITVRPVSLG